MILILHRNGVFDGIVGVRIVIEDINDNPPRFPKNVTLYIAESSTVGSEFRINGATDKDGDEQNQVYQYR